jgi:hypothetical protein
VHRNYFEPPHEEFSERTLWSLENAFTESFKELVPIRQYEVTAKLGKFVQPLVEANVPATAPQLLSVGGD